MKLFYNVEILASGTNQISEHLVETIATDLGTDLHAGDEIEPYRAVLCFDSELKPSAIRLRVRAILAMYNMTLRYIDVVYRYESEVDADRFIVYADGTEKDYTGHMIYEEDK